MIMTCDKALFDRQQRETWEAIGNVELDCRYKAMIAAK